MQRTDPGCASRHRKPRHRWQVRTGTDRGSALILGAIIAGGAARRFGSDKGVALLDGKPLLDHVTDLLRPHVDTIAIVGRAWRDLPRIEDRPSPALGPMGGIAGALSWAESEGFDLVLTLGCDTPVVPPELFKALIVGAPAWCGENPVIGAWPTALFSDALLYAATDARRSVRGWAEAIGGTRIAVGGIVNLNTTADLAMLKLRR